MKVISVKVDEMPKSCGEYCLMKYVNDTYPQCCALPDEISEITGNPYDMKYRRSDCPLESEDCGRMNIKDFKVGQTVYVELIGDASRGKAPEQCIEEWEITYVGRKYIKAGKRSDGRIWGERTFEYRDSCKSFVQKTNYCADYILYTTRQEIEEKHEKNRLFREIEKRFRFGSQKDISLEQLREIHGILESVKNENSDNTL